MPEENPHDPLPEIVDAEAVDAAPGTGIGGKDAYNLVTDLATGANLRAWDNNMQVLALLICTPLGALIGYRMATVDRGFGAMAGGLLGLLAGLFGSGIFLMVYRALRHFRGKHD